MRRRDCGTIGISSPSSPRRRRTGPCARRRSAGASRAISPMPGEAAFSVLRHRGPHRIRERRGLHGADIVAPEDAHHPPLRRRRPAAHGAHRPRWSVRRLLPASGTSRRPASGPASGAAARLTHRAQRAHNDIPLSTAVAGGSVQTYLRVRAVGARVSREEELAWPSCSAARAPPPESRRPTAAPPPAARAPARALCG